MFRELESCLRCNAKTMRQQRARVLLLAFYSLHPCPIHSLWHITLSTPPKLGLSEVMRCPMRWVPWNGSLVPLRAMIKADTLSFSAQGFINTQYSNNNAERQCFVPGRSIPRARLAASHASHRRTGNLPCSSALHARHVFADVIVRTTTCSTVDTSPRTYSA